jgi:NAD(P)H-flavin reductase/ferredoxin
MSTTKKLASLNFSHLSRGIFSFSTPPLTLQIFSCPIVAAKLTFFRVDIPRRKGSGMEQRSHKISIDGQSFRARHGELLLDEALANGFDLPHSCKAGHCGTCCVRIVSGKVDGGESSEPETVLACQSRIIGDVNIENTKSGSHRTVGGTLVSLVPLSPDVLQVEIKTDFALPYLAGQYVLVGFDGYPSRPFSISQPVRELGDRLNGRSVWFHVQRTKGGRVTSALGKGIRPGHRAELKGPFGSAHFRPNQKGPLILVASSTGFAPIWSIAIAALREQPERMIMIVAGGRTIESLYMWPALAKLAKFPNVFVVPVCGTPQTWTDEIRHGRLTDFLPPLEPSDTLYVCGAPGMVEQVKSIAANVDAVCYADPFYAPGSNVDRGGVSNHVALA